MFDVRNLTSIPSLSLMAAAVVFGAAIFLGDPLKDPLDIRVVGDTAYLNGTTNGRSQTAIRKLVRDHPQVRRLVLQQMPGTQDMTSNYRLARSVRKAGLATELEPTSRIASGAVDLFIAGTERTVACGAQIGVHSWGSTGYDAQDVSWDTHRPMSRDFLADMGLDPDFYDFKTEAAKAADIHWMTDAEMERWDVATEPRDCSQSSNSSE